MNVLIMALASILTTHGGSNSKQTQLEIFPVKPTRSLDGESFDYLNQRLRPLKQKPYLVLDDVEKISFEDGEKFVIGENAEKKLNKAAKKLRGQQVAIVHQGEVIATT